jgi:hypothetical protein
VLSALTTTPLRSRAAIFATAMQNIFLAQIDISSTRNQMSGNATSMIGLCQESKDSPDALRRSAGVNSFLRLSACVGLSAAVSIRE